MKIRKILSAFLAVLMTASCMSVVAFANDAELEADVAPLVFKITTAGADQQRCTKKDGVIDEFGRTVQQIIPNASVNPTSNAMPAWISSDTEQTTMQNAGNAYRYVKVVYYTSHAATAKPTMTIFRNNGGGKNWASTGRSVSPVVGNTAAQAGKWQTAIFEAPEGYYGTDFIYGVMFAVFGNDQVQKHVGDTVYIGHIALYDTLEKAQAADNDFEGTLVLSGIKVGGTAVAGFNAATTEYTVDLGGKDSVPEIIAVGKGNANDLKIEKGAVDFTTGKATAKVTAGDKVYTLNFTGGATKTDKTPIIYNLANTYTGTNQGTKTKIKKTDEFSREFYDQIPDTSVTVRGVFPGGHFDGNTAGYKVLKIVYRTSEDYVPTGVSVNAAKSDGKWVVCGNGSIEFAETPAKGKWNVLYYPLKDVVDDTAGNKLIGIKYWQLGMGEKKASETTSEDYYQLGFVGLFGSMLDAKAHNTVFEGDLNITEIKVGGTAVAFTNGVATVDAKGAAKVPEVTLTATGNTNNLVITNGKFDTAGNAVTTVKNGNETVATINFTGGQPREIEPIIPKFEWAGARDQGIAGVEKITDEFSRTYTQYAPALTYFENGSDMIPTAYVSPGGNILTATLPEGMSRDDYTIMKVVYKTPIDYIPKLTRYTVKDGKHTSIGQTNAQYVNAPEKNKWNVVYFDIPKSFSYYQFYFTGDACTNHMGELFEMGYAGLFADLEDAKAHKSVFEGEFAITDVLLDGSSIGNVTTYSKDLAGAGELPKLTVVATGDAEGVVITNGTINAEGKATSTVKKGDTALVTVSFTGGSTEFKITNLLVNGKAIDGFAQDKKEYTMNLGFAATEPVVTYEYQGEAKTLAIITAATVENNVTSKYVTTVKDGKTVLYTITFNVDTNKPEMLLNTLYKLNADKKLTVAYLGGSVTSGTGSTNSNTKSWRGITRDWFKSTFPNAQITEVNGAIGGTGAVFGVFRNQKQILDTAAGTPDLLFIETVINDSYDGTYADNSYVRYTESIIKQTLEQNPKCDIILIVTGDSGTFATDAASATPVTGLGYKALGEHYNIPVVYVGFELAHQIKRDYGADFSKGAEGWKYYFQRSGAIDGVHPNDNGYAHYAQTIINQCLTPNLPTTFTPVAADYAVKTNPADAYCEAKGYGSVMIDADMVNPAIFVNDTNKGGFTAASGSGLHGNIFKSYKEGDVVSLEFNSSNLGIWTWSYGTENGKNGTDMLVSIDGGEPKKVNVYRSYPNHKVYFLAKDLDNTKTHTVRIYHMDSANPIDIRWFLMWGMPEGEAASIKTVPYFDFEKEEYSVTLGGKAFAEFDKETNKYEIPVELTEGQSYPEIGFNVRDDFYGWAIEQADGDNNVATLTVDNVGVYKFEFVNSNAVEIKTVTDSKLGENSGSVEFTEAAAYKLQFKAADADWADATEYAAGTTKIDGLAPGVYEVRYVVDEGVYGLTKSFNIWTIYPYENIYYVTTGGTGDGKSANTPAGARSCKSIIEAAATYFGDKAKTEKCYIVLVGDVIHDSVNGVDLKLFKDVVITSEYGALLNIQTSLDFLKVEATSGKLTFDNVNVRLGNPNAAQGKIDGEIMIHFFGNEVEINNMKITDWAVNASGERRTVGICLDYYGDGKSGVEKGLGRPVTINSPELSLSAIRLTGWGAGDEEGNATYILENVTFKDILKLGGHVNKEINKGVIKAYLNNGLVSTALVSGDEKTVQIGTVAFIHNGGTAENVKVTSNSDTDETAVDRVVIFNNGTKAGTLTKDKIDYILHGAVGGTADITAGDNYRLTGFTFETDKQQVVINKGQANEKVIAVTDGKASIAVADLAAGEYTVTYEDIPKPEGIVEVTASIKLGREPGTKPAGDNHLVVIIADRATDEVIKTIDLEDANTETDENGCINIDLSIDIKDITGEYVRMTAVKNGYAPFMWDARVEELEEELVIFFECLAEEFENGHGDIKGSIEAQYGDGVIDIDDFIRILRGFDPDNSENSELLGALDLNEDGAVTVADLSIVKGNFGFGEGSGK